MRRRQNDGSTFRQAGSAASVAVDVNVVSLAIAISFEQMMGPTRFSSVTRSGLANGTTLSHTHTHIQLWPPESESALAALFGWRANDTVYDTHTHTYIHLHEFAHAPFALLTLPRSLARSLSLSLTHLLTYTLSRAVCVCVRVCARSANTQIRRMSTTLGPLRRQCASEPAIARNCRLALLTRTAQPRPAAAAPPRNVDDVVVGVAVAVAVVVVVVPRIIFSL